MPEALELTVNYPNLTQSIMVTVDFDGAVENVSFTIFDIDVGGNSSPFSFSSTIPEPKGHAAAVGLLLFTGVHFWRRRRAPANPR